MGELTAPDALLESYAKKTDTTGLYGERFNEHYTYFSNMGNVVNDTRFRFLNRIEAPTNYVYLYYIHCVKNGVAKLGKATKPWCRLLKHFAGYKTYGYVRGNYMECVFSRVPYFEPLDPEKKFLIDFKLAFPRCVPLADEFFIKLKKEAAREFVFNYFSNETR